MRFAYRGGARFTISADELNTKGFRFSVEAAVGILADPATGRPGVTTSQWDFAPGRDRLWSYEIRLRPSRLLVKSFSTIPAKPTAGKTFTVRLTATRNDTGVVLSRGQVRCAARIGGKDVKRRAQTFSGGGRRASLPSPPRPRKVIRGSITIVFEGRKLTKVFSRKIG